MARRQTYNRDDIRAGIQSTAAALGIDPVDLATTISYETAGTFDPTKRGPTTQWGTHRGLIQFGEPQARQHGVDWSDPIGSQLGPNGAVASYLRSTGVKPGMGLMDIYSAINAGGVGRENRSDANNGGAPGTVADKVNNQMAGHRQKAIELFGGQGGTISSGFDPERAASTSLMASAAPQPPASERLRRSIFGDMMLAETLQDEDPTIMNDGYSPPLLPDEVEPLPEAAPAETTPVDDYDMSQWEGLADPVEEPIAEEPYDMSVWEGLADPVDEPAAAPVGPVVALDEVVVPGRTTVEKYEGPTRREIMSGALSHLSGEEQDAAFNAAPANEYGFKEEMLNTALFGTLDEVRGGMRAGMNSVANVFGLGDGLSIGDHYDKAVAEERMLQQSYRDENAGASLGASVAGGLLVGPARAGAAALTQGGSAIGRAANAIVNPTTNAGRAASSIGLGAATGAAGAFGEAEGSISERADNAMMGAGIGAGIGSIFPALGALARGVRTVSGGTVKGSAQLADDFEAIGAPATAGLVSGNRSAQFAERSLENMPVAGRAITRATDQAYDAFEGAVGNRVRGYGTSRTEQDIGDQLQRAGAASEQVFRDRAGRLYDRAGQRMAGEMAEAGATNRLVQELSDEVDRLSNFEKGVYGTQLNRALQRASDIQKDLQDGLGYDALQRARSHIGRMAADETDQFERAYLNRLRASLTEDMGATAQRVGPEAVKANDTANAFYRRYTNENSDRRLDLSLGDTRRPNVNGEQVYKLVMNQSKSGDTKLNALRRQLFRTGQREAWDDMVATTLDRMGRSSQPDGTVDEFSPARFLSEWNRLAPEAKRTLFSGTRQSSYPADLERVVRLAQRFKDYGKSANHSNTANVEWYHKALAAPGLVGATLATGSFMTAGTGLAVGAAYGGTSLGMSRLLTYPPFVRWLSNAPRAASNSRTGGLLGHTHRLTDLAREATDPGIKNMIGQYIQHMETDEERAR